MRAATLFVAVLCATLPAVHGRERPRTSQSDSPRPDKDGTRTGKTEDPNAAGPINQASNLCKGYQEESDPLKGYGRPICEIDFWRQDDGGCRVEPKERRQPAIGKPSSEAICFSMGDDDGEGGAGCFCSSTECNGDTFYEALVQLIGPETTPWLDKCRQALDQLERTANVENEETPTTGKPKQDKATNPPNPARTPKDSSNAKTTSAAPSRPVPEGPNSQMSTSCSGELAYQGGVKGNEGPSYCAYEFTTVDDKRCSAIPQERFVAKEKDFSGSGGTICDKADGGKIICLCEGFNCNNNTEAISKKLKEFLGIQATEWKQDCLGKLDEIERESEGRGETKSTTSKDTEEPGETNTPTSEIETGPSSTPADGTGVDVGGKQQSSSTPSKGSNEITKTADGDPFETIESTTTPPITTTSEGEYQDDTTQFDATTSDATTSQPPDESTGQDDPTTQLTVVTTEETSTTQVADEVKTEVKSTTVPPVVTTTEMTTVSSEGATTTVATTTTTSTKEPETTTQTVSSDPATTSEASTTTETTTTTQSTTSTSITTTTPETTTTTTTTTTTSETPTEEPETTAHTEPENEQDTTTTPGSGIPEAEATSGVKTTIGLDGNGGSNDNQGLLGAEGDSNDEKNGKDSGGGLPGWLIALLVFLALVVISLLIAGFIMYTKKKEVKPEDIEGGEKAAAAPPAPTVPAQAAPVVKAAPLVSQAVQKKNAPLAPKQPTLREQIMKEQWEQQLKLNAALDAAKKAPAVPAVPEVVPPKKEEEKAPVGGQVQVVDEQLPVLPTQEDNSLKEAQKVEAVKETSWKEKATQGTVDSVKTQASESHKSEKKKSSPHKELSKNDV